MNIGPVNIRLSVNQTVFIACMHAYLLVIKDIFYSIIGLTKQGIILKLL